LINRENEFPYNHKMNILFINHHRKEKTHFRAGHLAEVLASSGHDVTLLCVSDKRRFSFLEYDQNGVHYVESPDMLPGKLRSGWDPWCTFRRTQWLRGCKKHFDLIHAFDSRPATIYPIQPLLKNNNIPLFMDWCDWWGRGGLITELRPGWYQLLFGTLETYYEEHFRNSADGTTVIAQALKVRAENLGVPHKRIFHIPGGVDTTEFCEHNSNKFRNKFEIPENIPVIGYSAADVTMDAAMVLESMRLLVPKYPELLLIMTGNIPDGFNKTVESMKLQNNVRHYGYIPYADLPDLLSCADLFALPFPDKPSNRGRWPNKLGNYMSLGRPTVSNPCGDVKTLFENEDIGLLAADNCESFAEKLEILINNKPLRLQMGNNARKIAIEHYSWNIIIKKLISAYSAVLHELQRELQ